MNKYNEILATQSYVDNIAEKIQNEIDKLEHAESITTIDSGGTNFDKWVQIAELTAPKSTRTSTRLAISPVGLNGPIGILYVEVSNFGLEDYNTPVLFWETANDYTLKEYLNRFALAKNGEVYKLYFKPTADNCIKITALEENNDIKLIQSDIFVSDINVDNEMIMYSESNDSIGQLYLNSHHGEIFNDYKKNIASGSYSHAEGYGTTASGYSSHAEGYGTTASGTESHAEGYNTYSSAYSHAEGIQSRAEGENSHAEGNTAIASGNNSHAEGLGTKAEGESSHTEGNNTKAKGENSHAEGYLAEAYGDYSHAEGNSNGKLYLGEYNRDDIISSFKTMPFSMAFGKGSHVEGQTNLATGNGSHAEGLQNIAAGDGSHAEGRRTIASGEYQHVEGKYNIEDTTDTYAHIVGGGTSINDRKNIHTIDWKGNAEFTGDVFGGKAETELTIGNTLNCMRGEATIADYGLEIIIYYEYMDKFNAVKEMELTINSVSYTIPKNKLIPTNIVQSPGLFDDEKGGFIYLYKVIDHYPDIDTDYINANNIDIVATVVDGYNLNKNGNAEFAGTVNAKDLSIKGKSVSELIVGKKIENGGEIFNDYKNNIASDFFSHAEGYSTTASGLASHAEGYSTTASGLASHAEGYGTEATNDFAHAEGYETKASGLRSHAEGSASEAHGEGSHAEGRKTKSTGQYAHSEGFLVEAYGYGSHAEGDSSRYNYTGTDYTSEAIINAFNTTPFSMAFGRGSHIEGQANLAIGQSSHAEGAKNIAKSDFSHVEGLRNISSGEYQHVQGKYNIEDTENKYAHIIGGGTSNTDRKNIHTIDWNGNAEFAGDIYVNTIDNRSESNKLITQKELNEKVSDEINKVIDSAPGALDTLNELSAALNNDENFSVTVTNSLAEIQNTVNTKPGIINEQYGEVFNDYSKNEAGSYAHAEGWGTKATGEDSHAEGHETVASGLNAHAEACGTIASGDAAHAEGLYTVAEGEASHAQNRYSEARIDNSHAEGVNTLTEAKAYRLKAIAATTHNRPHTNEDGSTIIVSETILDTMIFNEGTTLIADGVTAGMSVSAITPNGKSSGIISKVKDETTLSIDISDLTLIMDELLTENCQILIDNGKYGNETFNQLSASAEFSSHAEGTNTTARLAAHAEGVDTEANGFGSHAEGIGTITNCEGQHVQGRYNETDSTKALIVGNGTSKEDRKNIYTLDWEGSAEFAGDIYAKQSRVLTEESLEHMPATPIKFNNKIIIDYDGDVLFNSPDGCYWNINIDNSGNITSSKKYDSNGNIWFE